MTLEEIFKEEDKSNEVFNSYSTPPKNNEIKENAMMEKTLEIETLDLGMYLDRDKKIELPIEKDNEEAIKAKEVAEEIVPEKNEKDHSMQEAFINCSVLGFITAFAGASWLINIINHI